MVICVMIVGDMTIGSPTCPDHDWTYSYAVPFATKRIGTSFTTTLWRNSPNWTSMIGHDRNSKNPSFRFYGEIWTWSEAMLWKRRRPFSFKIDGGLKCLGTASKCLKEQSFRSLTKLTNAHAVGKNSATHGRSIWRLNYTTSILTQERMSRWFGIPMWSGFQNPRQRVKSSRQRLNQCPMVLCSNVFFLSQYTKQPTCYRLSLT